jgi:hypothetical protein
MPLIGLRIADCELRIFLILDLRIEFSDFPSTIFLKSPTKIKEINLDGFVKSLKTVTPAKAGVQKLLILLGSRFRGNDKMRQS